MKVPVLPFERFLLHDEIVSYLKKLAAAAPELVEYASVGTSREGREIPMVTITNKATGADQDKPAFLIFGNVHADELSGSQVALYNAWQLVKDHKDGGILDKVAFYIVPRTNPDGAEFSLTATGVIRSAVHYENEPLPNSITQADIDGNGMLLQMRVPNPNGRYAKHPKDDRLMTVRTDKTPGPYYDVFPEGLINNWDGSLELTLDGRHVDWNRNWTYDWRPEPQQWGAGDYPLSEPEIRQLVDFMTAHRNIFQVLSYHTGGRRILRAPSSGSDADVPHVDLKQYKELANEMGEIFNFPVVPVYQYRNVGDPDLNLRGHFHNFGYFHQGWYAFEVELGQMCDEAEMYFGFDKTYKDFQMEVGWDDKYCHVLAWQDKNPDMPKAFVPWKKFNHPQLGPIEIGGPCPKVLRNHPMKRLKTISANSQKAVLKLAERHPDVSVSGLEVTAVGGGVYRIRGEVANTGVFSTGITSVGKGLNKFIKPRAELHLAKGVTLLSRRNCVQMGHLDSMDNWGSAVPLEWFVSVPEKVKTLGELKIIAGTGGTRAYKLRRK